MRGESWQAFLGDDDHIFVFDSPAKLLGYLNSGKRNDLNQHNKWSEFSRNMVANVQPRKSTSVSLVETPRELARRPSYEATLAVTRSFDLLSSFGNVLGINSITNWFHSYSILHNTRRGAEHYNSTNGLEEWTAVGRTVLDRWKGMTHEVENYLAEPEVPENLVAEAQAQLNEVAKEQEAKAAAAAEK